ncbi:MAG: hypothetical protein CVT48_00030 [Thermoplasmata archaeon HGW-Thermoplasmata-1]|nr:MAG: hypothetical protein CVT48_00030 [Thermoplasmata archaeon HGW-Thermoplasmata-1]
MAISSIAGAAASPVLVLIALAQAGAGYVTGFAPLSEYLPRSKPQDYIRHALIASACLGGTIAVFQSVYIVSASLLSLSDISAPFSIAAPLLPVLVLCISLLAVALASAFRIDYREIDRSEDCEIVRHTPSAVQIAVAATFFAMMLFSFGIAYAHNYDSLPQTGYAVLFTGLAALAFTPLFWQLAKNRKIQTTFYLCAVVIGISLALQIGLGGSISNYIIDGLILAWLPFSLVYVYELAGRKDADAVTVGSASIPLLLFAGSTVARFFGGTGPLIIGATIIAFSVVFAAALPHVETRLSESDEMRDYLEAAKREKGSLD